MEDISARWLLADPQPDACSSSILCRRFCRWSGRDQLAELLTDDDVERLKHLAHEGMGEDTLRGMPSDLAYLERPNGRCRGRHPKVWR